MNTHYPSNRPPLLASGLVKLPLGAVRPEGWLRRQLELMRDGLTGRLPEQSTACQLEGNAWVDPQGEGDNGWEKPPYWLRGYLRMACLLGEEALLDRARAWMEGVLGSKRADGYFGPEANRRNNDCWPNMIMLNALEGWFEFTGDERILDLMRGYFQWQLSLGDNLLRHLPKTPGEWQPIRGGDNLQSVLWLYNRTGEDYLLDLARRLCAKTLGWEEGFGNSYHRHGVNICQSFRFPAQRAQIEGSTGGWVESERIYQQVMGEFGQFPGGMFGADEPIRPGHTDPRQPAETCSMVEFMRSFQLLLGITGDPVHADRCEDIAFNTFPAAQTPDLKAIHYFTAPNMVQLDERYYIAELKEYSHCLIAFSSDERYGCCRYNVAGGWPNFAENLWMATPDNGLAAVMYAPCSVAARVGETGTEISIYEETDYPFREEVLFHVGLSEDVDFPLLLRTPGWCESVRYQINDAPLEPESKDGSAAIRRKWSDGDTLTVRFEMPPRVRVWEKQKGAVSVERGPLSFSVNIAENWERIGGSDEWPDWRVLPASPWNYGLVGEPDEIAKSLQIREVDSPAPILEPWTQKTAPVRILAKARNIPAWQLDHGLPGVLPLSPVESSESEEEIEMVPMGSARSRISVLPRVAK